jgi:hypothetical protein
MRTKKGEVVRWCYVWKAYVGHAPSGFYYRRRDAAADRARMVVRGVPCGPVTRISLPLPAPKPEAKRK